MSVHRVGTITLGLTMIVIGILFLVGMLIPLPLIYIVAIAWPIIFITLGIEILWGNGKSQNIELFYDKTAILLVIILTIFAMFLAVIGNTIRIQY